MRRHAKAPVRATLAALLSLAAFACVPGSAIAAEPVVSFDAPSPGYTEVDFSGTIDPEGGTFPPGSPDDPNPILWIIELSTEPANPASYFELGTYQSPYKGDFFGGLSGSDAESTDPVPFSGFVNGLQPGTEYGIRVKVQEQRTAQYTIRSQAHTFTTKSPVLPPAAVEADDASAVLAYSAHFSGRITAGDPDPGFDSSCRFEYVTDAQFSQTQDENQWVIVRADGGSFKLTYEGEETTAIDFDATAEEVEAALQALSAIGTGGATVSGGPGDVSGTLPYEISFPATDAAQLSVDASGLTSSSATPEAEAFTTQEGFGPGFREGIQSIPCEPETVKGTSSVEVQADATGLEPETVYHLRLRAENLGGATVDVAPSTFETETGEPTFGETFVSEVTTDSATLNSSIKPGADPTTYHFEYLTLAAYEAAGKSFAGAASTPESASIGEDNQVHPVSEAIGGLAPDTAYRYRVVATNSKSPAGGTAGPVRAFHTNAIPVGDSCPNAAIRAQQGSAYLPECRAYEIVNKPSLDLGDVTRAPYASDDGEQIAYLSTSAGDDARGAGVASYGIARRSSTGWVRTSGDPKSYGPASHTAFNELFQMSPDFSRALMNVELAISPDDDNDLPDLVRVDTATGDANKVSPPSMSVFRTGGASTDLARVTWRGDTSGSGIFVSEGSSHEEVSVSPDGAPVGGFAAFAGENKRRGLNVGFPEEGNPSFPIAPHGGMHGISDDARRVYFVSDESLPDLQRSTFVRDMAATPARTVAVGKAALISASHDGSTAYVASKEQLSGDGTPGGGIYRFELEAPEGERLHQLVADPKVASAMASDDQSHIYWRSQSALVPGAVAGADNLYVWSAEDGVRLIASGGGGLLRVTLDGRFMLFYSSSPIEGAPTNGHLQLFLYDAAAEELSCASCRPDGSPSQGDAHLSLQSYGQPSSPSNSRSRALANDGRVFFDSTDRLVAGDQSAAQDVYVYDEGRVALISSGSEETDSYLMENSDDGDHVFFITRAALVGADRDAAEFDLYDAHLGGGFLEPPPPPAPCEGEACRGPISNGATGAGPTTSTFVGPGNPKPKPRCKKGKVRRHGKCVKRKHKHGKAKRNSKAGGRASR